MTIDASQLESVCFAVVFWRETDADACDVPWFALSTLRPTR